MCKSLIVFCDDVDMSDTVVMLRVVFTLVFLVFCFDAVFVDLVFVLVVVVVIYHHDSCYMFYYFYVLLFYWSMLLVILLMC